MFCCAFKADDFVGASVKEMQKKYKILDTVVLGKGAFSQVKKAVDIVDDSEFAVKIINKDSLSFDCT